MRCVTRGALSIDCEQAEVEMEQQTGNRRQLQADEVVIHVPKGTGKHFKIEESDATKLQSEIVVQISKQRRTTALPVLGVIVK
jgi:hypothetical protein